MYPAAVRAAAPGRHAEHSRGAPESGGRKVPHKKDVDEPVTTKQTRNVVDFDKGYLVGMSSMQGWRQTMEDQHVGYMRMPGDAEASFFAVYDGHGGLTVAEIVGERLHHKLATDDLYKRGKISDALRGVMIDMDKELMTDPILRNTLVGCTAAVSVIRQNKIYCANLGDSRIIASVSGYAVPLSFDHKPDKGTERMRILEAGGWISHNGRANGIITTSRTFGDFPLKNSPYLKHEYQVLSCYPDVSIKDLTPELEFLLLACDGIWDVKTSQEVVDIVRPLLAQGLDPGTAAEHLMDECIAKNVFSPKGFDNMTVVIVCLMQGMTRDDYCRMLGTTKPHQIDPRVTLITLETGPPTNDKLPIALNPKRQRRWGVASKQPTFDEIFIPQGPPSMLRQADLSNSPSTSRSRGHSSTMSDELPSSQQTDHDAKKTKRRQTEDLMEANRAADTTSPRSGTHGKPPNTFQKIFSAKRNPRS